ncbi:MAG: MarR family transcriptional regulator [Gordonibacter sp.]
MDVATFKTEMFSATCSLQRDMHEVMAPVCQQCGLTLQQLHVLVELLRMPGLTAGQLSDRTGILRTNFSSVCRKLEDRGLIERQRSRADKRSLELRVTQEGRALLANVDEEVNRRYGKVFESEPQETFDAIVAGFRALAALTEKVRG